MGIGGIDRLSIRNSQTRVRRTILYVALHDGPYSMSCVGMLNIRSRASISNRLPSTPGRWDGNQGWAGTNWKVSVGE